MTWAEADKPNWVGHLITKYCPHPRFDPAKEEQSQEYRDHALLVYNYARGGDKVDGVQRQIQRFFLPKVGKKPEWAPWNADNTLFCKKFNASTFRPGIFCVLSKNSTVTWIGINDCAYVQFMTFQPLSLTVNGSRNTIDNSRNIEDLFELQETVVYRRRS